MRRRLIGIGVAVLATAAAFGVVRLTSTEGWAARQPGVGRVHIVELRDVDQIEAHVDDAASARVFADGLRSRSGAEEYRAILTWTDGDVERSILVEPRTHEEAWRLASADLPDGVTAQRVGLHDGRIDAVEYTARTVTGRLPISWFVSSLKLGPVTIQGPSTTGLNDALAELDGLQAAAGAWTEESVVDIAARLAGRPGVKVSGQRVEIRPGHGMGDAEAVLRELARGTGTVSYEATFEADLSLEDCVGAAPKLAGETAVDWRCGDALRVVGDAARLGREMPGLAEVVDLGATHVRRDVAGDGSTLDVRIADDAAPPEEIARAIRAIGWDGEALLDVGGEVFRSTATGAAEPQRGAGPIVEAWNAGAVG